MEDPFADKRDRLIKDRGDIGEVLGYLVETKVRGIAPDDLFAPLIWAKLKGGLTTHGIDGIGFIWGSESETGQMILCEWKHTAQSGSIGSPCSSITTTVQGGMCGEARSAARCLAWERLARSLLSCVSSSHRSNSAGPNRSLGSNSRTTR